MKQLVVTGLGVGVDELLVVERRATVLDGFGQDLGDRSVQSANLNRRQRLRLTIEAQSGRKEDLVGVDIANARDDVLIRQHRLQWCRSASKDCREAVPADLIFEGIEAQVGKFGYG